jgi:hypothetical protein
MLSCTACGQKTGQPCCPDNKCSDGLFCIDGKCATKGDGKYDSPCGSDDDCNLKDYPGLHCYQNKCVCAKEGQLCGDDMICTSGGGGKFKGDCSDKTTPSADDVKGKCNAGSYACMINGAVECQDTGKKWDDNRSCQEYCRLPS